MNARMNRCNGCLMISGHHTLTPFCKIATGNSDEGYDVSHNRKSGCVVSGLNSYKNHAINVFIFPYKMQHSLNVR